MFDFIAAIFPTSEEGGGSLGGKGGNTFLSRRP